jgi:hypothetical protein
MRRLTAILCLTLALVLTVAIGGCDTAERKRTRNLAEQGNARAQLTMGIPRISHSVRPLRHHAEGSFHGYQVNAEKGQENMLGW